jgi:YtkA-like
MMRRSVLVALLVGTVMATAVGAADLKVVKTQKAKDVTVSLLSESGRWTPGTNAFVVELTKDGKPFDAGKVTLSTSMAMPGMAPMVAGASLQPDGPGRYRGTISFPDGGERQVTVAWDGPAGKGSTRFPVPVR